MPDSKHFQVERLADGVYAAIASEQGYAICNAGIIDLGDKTIVFDSFKTPDAAEDLLRAAHERTSHKVSYVINSHYHHDHIRGNQVFSPDTAIISTSWTREAIAKNEPQRIKSQKENVPQELLDAQSKLDAEKNPNRRRELAFWITYHKASIESLSQLKMRLPNITFEHMLTIHGAGRTVKLLSFRGHTESDVVL